MISYQYIIYHPLGGYKRFVIFDGDLKNKLANGVLLLHLSVANPRPIPGRGGCGFALISP